MAKKDKPASPPADRRFIIKTPNPTFSGVKRGITFKDGLAEIQDATLAHACLEFGYQVLDAETREEAWPKDAPADPTGDDGVKKTG